MDTLDTFRTVTLYADNVLNYLRRHPGRCIPPWVVASAVADDIIGHTPENRVVNEVRTSFRKTVLKTLQELIRQNKVIRYRRHSSDTVRINEALIAQPKQVPLKQTYGSQTR